METQKTESQKQTFCGRTLTAGKGRVTTSLAAFKLSRQANLRVQQADKTENDKSSVNHAKSWNESTLARSNTTWFGTSSAGRKQGNISHGWIEGHLRGS
jgi:hypothetical protein